MVERPRLDRAALAGIEDTAARPPGGRRGGRRRAPGPGRPRRPWPDALDARRGRGPGASTRLGRVGTTATLQARARAVPERRANAGQRGPGTHGTSRSARHCAAVESHTRDLDLARDAGRRLRDSRSGCSAMVGVDFGFLFDPDAAAVRDRLPRGGRKPRLRSVRSPPHRRPGSQASSRSPRATSPSRTGSGSVGR